MQNESGENAGANPYDCHWPRDICKFSNQHRHLAAREFRMRVLIAGLCELRDRLSLLSSADAHDTVERLDVLIAFGQQAEPVKP